MGYPYRCTFSRPKFAATFSFAAFYLAQPYCRKDVTIRRKWLVRPLHVMMVTNENRQTEVPRQVTNRRIKIVSQIPPSAQPINQTRPLHHQPFHRDITQQPGRLILTRILANHPPLRPARYLIKETQIGVGHIPLIIPYAVIIYQHRCKVPLVQHGATQSSKLTRPRDFGATWGPFRHQTMPAILSSL